MTDIETNTDYFRELVDMYENDVKYGLEVKNITLAETAYKSIWTVADLVSYAVQDKVQREVTLDYIRRKSAVLKPEIVKLYMEILEDKETYVEECERNHKTNDEEDDVAIVEVPITDEIADKLSSIVSKLLVKHIEELEEREKNRK